MARFLGYANHIWKEHQSFTYTGVPQSFTLQPGTYLLTCGGALGGHTFDAETGNDSTRTTGIGGVSYGIIQLNESKTLQAYVGGDGENSYAATRTYGRGGWNGGGDGAPSYHSLNTSPTYPYDFGAGGGGASDIRLLSEDDVPVTFQPTLPAEYQQVEYLDTTNVTQYLNTGWTPTSNDMIETKISFASDITSSQSVCGVNVTSSVWNFNIKNETIATTDPLIPNMTSDSDQIGIITYGGGYCYGSFGYIEPWNAFDGNTSTNVYYKDYDVTNGWLQYEFRIAKPIATIVARMSSSSGPTDVSLYVYDENDTETLIETKSISSTADYTFTVNQIVKRFKFVYGYSSWGQNCFTYTVQAYAMTDMIQPMVQNIYGSGTSSFINTGIPANTPAIYKIKPTSVVVDDITVDTETTSGSVANSPMGLFATRSNDSPAVYSDPFHGKLYFFRAISYKTNAQFVCDPGYYFDSPVSCTISGRTYTSTGTSPMIAFVVHTIGYSTMQIISTDRNSVQYTCDPGPNDIVNASVEYKGMTFYWGSTGNAMQGTFDDSSGNLQTYPESLEYTSSLNGLTSSAILQVLESLHVEPASDLDTKKCELIPCYRKSDHVPGMYDTVSEQFITGEVSGVTFEIGPEGTYGIPIPISQTTESYRHGQSLLSRIIVAGGAGGGSAYVGYGYDSTDRGRPDICNYGGGIVGSPYISKNDTTKNLVQATQSSGYEFGLGETAAYPSSSSATGSSGGGGGWYGGYTTSPALSISYASSPGSGGSGYVLTASSYKPEGYIPNSDFYMTHALTLGNRAESAFVKIYKLDDATNVNTDDVIEFPQVGHSETIALNPGRYTMKCWGADGGISYNVTDGGRGGYAEGKVLFQNIENLQVSVGGSGIGDMMSQMLPSFPDMYYNGGGVSSDYALSTNVHGGGGGGASDVRVVTSLEPTEISDVRVLPDAFQSIEYIEFDGHQYYDTGFYAQYDCSMEANIMITDATVAAGDSWLTIMSCGISNENDEFGLYINSKSGGYCAFHYNDGFSDNAWKWDKNVKYNIKSTYNRAIFDHKLVARLSPVTSSANNSSMCIGVRNQNANQTKQMYFIGRIYECKIWKGIELIFYGIPCIEIESNKIGYYDLISETFIENSGTTDPVAGNPTGQTIFPIIDKFDNDATLNARLIVAGGGGGCGTIPGLIGGVGGGLTGGSPVGGSYGYTPGPGTQTESPQNTSYPIINGGFGYGGNAGSNASGYAGGAGGGGWYGGSGTYPSASNASEKGGCGGSGFVLSETSIGNTPEGYLLNENYFMTDVTLTQGGNNLTRGLSKVEIVVDQISKVKFLCKDEQGVKRFNPELNRWVFLAGTVSVDLFETYGSRSFDTDAGLLDDYEILIYDPDDTVESMDFDIVPPAQHVVCDDLTKIMIDRIVSDTDYDPSLYDVEFTVTREPRGAMTKVHTDLMINKKQITEKTPKVYSVSFFTK